MNKKIIIGIVVVLVAGIFYFILSGGSSDTTGLVVDESLFDIDSFMGDGVGYENLTNVSREQAFNILVESEQIIESMIESELPFVFMNDTLLKARRVFEQAEYAAILREEVNASTTEKSEAQKALRLLDWEEITYDGVIVYTNQIKERRDRIFTLYDSLIATKISLMRESGLDTPITGMVSLTEGVNESTGEQVFISDSVLEFDEEAKELFDESSKAFYEDREDAGDLLIELRKYLESKRLESATSNVLKNNLANFVKRNWWGILIFLIMSGAVAYVVYGNAVSRGLREKIEKMKLERRAILQLIKKLQQERFNENKISEFVYKIRMKKYRNELDVIKAKLPILESKYKTNGKNKGRETVKEIKK